MSGAFTRPSFCDLSSLVALLRWRAETQPDRLAYIFLRDRDEDAVQCTYGELDRRARVIAARLVELGAAGERVLLLYPPGLDYVAGLFGCLVAGATAVPVYPPRASRPSPRLRALAEDARPALALTVGGVLEKLDVLLRQTPELAALRWLATDGPLGEPLAGERIAAPAAGDVAILQYTSGSTDTPRGVRLTHRNLLHNLALIERAFGHTPDSRGVVWLPPYHDMGLIGGILQPLFGGFPVVLMPPAAFLQSPVRWLRAVSRYQATSSGGPDFAYDLCVRKIPPAEREGLDLGSWTVAFNGAEPVRRETLDRFAAAFAPYGFRREAFFPCYGLAEATLLVSGAGGASAGAPPSVRLLDAEALGRHRVESAPGDEGRPVVGCGPAAAGVEVRIVHPETSAPCPPGQVGEIWVSSPSVADGYWSRPEESAATFQARCAGGEGPYLRTGDLGFLDGGELYVTGRIKELIVIRGRNHYPQDIERTVEASHPALRPGGGAAFGVEMEGEERLAVAHEVRLGHREVDPEEVAAAVRQAVAEQHGLQTYAVLLLAPGALPLTSSGKVQRRACRRGFLAGTLDLVGTSVLGAFMDTSPASPALPSAGDLLASPPRRRERRLVADLRRRVARAAGVEPQRVDPEKPLAAHGLDSLAVVELCHEIELGLGVALSPSHLLEETSLRELAREIVARVEAAGARPEIQADGIASLGASDVLPLSHGQRALWFNHLLAPASGVGHLACAFELVAPVEPAALRRAFDVLLARHPALRTTFHVAAGEPWQRVHPGALADVEELDASSWSAEEVASYLDREPRRPFDLEQGPLLRVRLLRRADGRHLLLLLAHHLVIDLWSLSILLRELAVLLRAEAAETVPRLPPLELGYGDFVAWQAEMLAGPEGERLWGYWRDRMEGAAPDLPLPTDRPRPAEPGFAGSRWPLRLEPALTQRLRRLAASEGVTLYVALLAGFAALLARWSGREEVVVGTPLSGRSRAAFAPLVGYFVDPVALRLLPADAAPFRDLLAQARRTVLGALEHQGFPLPVLVERLRPDRAAGRSALFQVLFVLQQDRRADEEGMAALALGVAGAAARVEGLEIASCALPGHAAELDLSLIMAPVAGGLSAVVEYRTDLFDRATAARLAGHLEVLLAAVEEDPGRCLRDLELLRDGERQQVVLEWNDTAVDRPAAATLPGLFAEQARLSPGAVALVAAGEELTYAELAARVSRLAHHLRALGVGPEVRVAVALERSVDLVVGLLGVLVAGGAYVPLDPDYPPQRLAFMLEDSRAALLLAAPRDLAGFPAGSLPVPVVDPRMAAAEDTGESLDPSLDPGNLAYVIYTSGSTGRPKGAMNSHGAIVNRLLWMQDRYGLTPDDRVLQKTPISFDVSVWELFWPLVTGARLVLAPPGAHRDSAALAALIRDQGITTVHFVPSMLQVFVDEPGLAGCGCLARVICSGEALPFDLQERFFVRLGCGLHNLYGPTEAAVDVTSWACLPPADRPTLPRPVVPIGRPIDNLRILLLDRALRPVPIGVPGELYIGGDGLARGYLGQPALTAAAFVPDPLGGVGERLYRTGDLARRLPTGALEFLGRADHQVKVRGVRVEPGEIEALLARQPGVREALVMARGDNGNARLIAYVVPAGEGNGHGDLASKLTAGLRRHLPDVMVPSAIVPLAAMPLLPNGKVDRAALPRPEPLAAGRPLLEPREPLEREIAAIWRDLLSSAAIGIDDNFFELGGHSLLLARVGSRLGEALGREVPVVDLLRYPTIRSLAGHLSGNGAASPPVAAAGPEARLGEGKERLRLQLARRRGSAEMREEGR